MSPAPPLCYHRPARRRKCFYFLTTTFLVCYISGTLLVLYDKSDFVGKMYTNLRGSDVVDKRQLLLNILGAKAIDGGQFLTATATTSTSTEAPLVTLPPPVPGFDLSNNNTQMVMRYDSFNVTEPWFGTEEDRKFFFDMPDNMTTKLGIVSSERLKGVLQIIPGGVANEFQDCGYSTRLESFFPGSDHHIVRRDVSEKVLLSPLLVPASSSFQHFVDGVLPKIAQAYELLRTWNVTLLIFPPKDSIITEIYAALGFPPSRLLRYTAGDYYSDFQINTCITPPMHPILWQKIRKLLEVPTAVSNSTSDVILFVRKSNARKIQNIKQVISFLTGRYQSRLKVINQGLHDLASARKTMSSAGVVIGVHGGAFYNMLFAPPRTAIVEIMPMSKRGNTAPKKLAHTIIWRIAQTMGHRYWRVSLLSTTPLGDLDVPLDSLSSTLDQVDQREESTTWYESKHSHKQTQ